MRLATYEQNGRTSVGVVLGERVVDLNRSTGSRPGSHRWIADVADVLHDTELRIDAARLQEADATLELSALHLLPPVLRPTKVIGVGMNYRSFVAQLGEPEPTHLSVFHKTSSALNAHNGYVERSPHAGDLVPEGELALIMGRHARRVGVADALEYVGALCCANDISAPDFEFRTSQWTAGKMLPTTCPLGPFAVTLDEVDLDSGLTVATYLDGIEIQRGHTSEMVFSIAELVAGLSELVDLEIGDVVLTGTPSDLGACDPPVLLRPGNVIEVEITGLGRLVNTICESSTR